MSVTLKSHRNKIVGECVLIRPKTLCYIDTKEDEGLPLSASASSFVPQRVLRIHDPTKELSSRQQRSVLLPWLVCVCVRIALVPTCGVDAFFDDV